MTFGQSTAHLLYRNFCSSLDLRTRIELVTTPLTAGLLPLNYLSILVNNITLISLPTLYPKELHANLSLIEPLHIRVFI